MLRIGTLVSMLLASMFCGILMISVAAGSIWPQMNSIAGPLVCGSNKLEITQYSHSYTPGSVDTVTTDYCVDPVTENKQEVTGGITLVAGLIDSLFLFGIMLVWTLGMKLKQSFSRGATA